MTSGRLRAVVVDDSALARLMIREALRQIGNIAVVGTADNGVKALDVIDRLSPDFVTLDLEMPQLDGIEVLRKLRQRGSQARVVMVSRHTSEGAAVTTEALMQGAFDFVLKPRGASAANSQECLRAALLPIVEAVRVSQTSDSLRDSNLDESRGVDVAPQAEVILVGCSTGGPDALRQLIPQLSDRLAASIAVVQHMPEGSYTTRLAARLNDLTALEVMEGSDGLPMQPGRVVVAPGGRQMGLARDGHRTVVQLSDDPPENGCRPAFDFLLRTAIAVVPGERILAVVLTGMGSDGTLGCRLVKDAGGHTIAQHPNGCVVYGMPKSVIDNGLADHVVPLGQLATVLQTLGR